MMIHNPGELALFIKSQRKRLKRNQTQLGEMVGLRQSTVSAFETNPEATKLDTLFRILAAADIEIELRPRDHSKKHTNWKGEW